MAQDDDEESARAIKRRQQRAAGDQSASLAHDLLKAPAGAIAKLDLDDDLREVVDRARAVTSHIARRRAERTLAGQLRSSGRLGEIRQALTNIERQGAAQPRLLHQAETWRERLLEEGAAAAAELPGGGADPLPRLIEAARKERSIGKPPGAGRALFRHIMELLKAEAAAPQGDDEAP